MSGSVILIFRIQFDETNIIIYIYGVYTITQKVLIIGLKYSEDNAYVVGQG
jgi:hypothetical protein